jgi:hypothetical protein
MEKVTTMPDYLQPEVCGASVYKRSDFGVNYISIEADPTDPPSELLIWVYSNLLQEHRNVLIRRKDYKTFTGSSDFRKLMKFVK